MEFFVFMDLDRQSQFDYIMYRASNDWLADLADMLENFEDHPNFNDVETFLMKKIDILQNEDNVEQQRLAIEKAAVHHSLNFTDKDGNSTGSWGVGSDAVKRAVKGY